MWHPVIDKLFWSLKLNDIRIGNKSLGLCQDKTCLVTPDSGTSLTTMPSWAYKIFKDNIYKSGTECAEGAEQDFGDLVFVIDGNDYPIPSHHWNSREINVNKKLGGTCKNTISVLDIKQRG